MGTAMLGGGIRIRINVGPQLVTGHAARGLDLQDMLSRERKSLVEPPPNRGLGEPEKPRDLALRADTSNGLPKGFSGREGSDIRRRH